MQRRFPGGEFTAVRGDQFTFGEVQLCRDVAVAGGPCLGLVLGWLAGSGKGLADVVKAGLHGRVPFLDQKSARSESCSWRPGAV